MQWFRFYPETLNNTKAQKLPGDIFKIWVNMLCVAAENDGVLPILDEVAFQIRAPLHVVLHAVTTLLEADLLTVTKNQHCESYAPKNWKERQYISDTSNERVKRHREKMKTVTCNVTVTPPEQNRTEQKERPPLPPKLADPKKVEGVLKNLKVGSVGQQGVGRFDVENHLQPDDYIEIYRTVPGWDKQLLFGKYNAWVREKGTPTNPRQAFFGWLKKFTKGKNP